jgi:hypothetical protein
MSATHAFRCYRWELAAAPCWMGSSASRWRARVPLLRPSSRALPTCPRPSLQVLKMASTRSARVLSPAIAARYRMPLLATRPLSLRAIALRYRRALSPRAIAACYRVLSGVLSPAIAVCYRCVLSPQAIGARYCKLSTCAIDVCYRRCYRPCYRRLLSAPAIATDALSLSTLYRYRRCYCPLLESISVFCLCARCAFLTACAHFSVPSARARGSDGHVHMSHAGLR